MKLMEMLASKMREVDLRNLSAKAAPSDEVPRGAKVLGVMSDDLKKLFVVKNDMSDMLNERCPAFHDKMVAMKKGLSKNPDPAKQSEFESLMRSHDLEHKRRELTRDYFWFCVREEFPETLYPEEATIQICQDWQVALISKELDFVTTLEQLADKFRAMVGNS